jgi:hypothetical protein
MKSLQDKVESQVSVCHGHNRVKCVGIAAANHIAKLLGYAVDCFSVIVLARELLELI